VCAAEKAAVDKYKAALKAHEVMHFDVTDKVVKGLPNTVSATGSDNQDAVANLQTAVDTGRGSLGHCRTRRRARSGPLDSATSTA
jgi:hypothetical protein